MRRPRWDERCGPQKKIRFRSAAKANQWERKHRGWFGKQRAYECPACGGWHLTSQEKRG